MYFEENNNFFLKRKFINNVNKVNIKEMKTMYNKLPKDN